ncbi:MAG: 23S rRNA (uracil(1939)-C(5))-methyltransferase RlmD [Bacteroidales bacterium]
MPSTPRTLTVEVDGIQSTGDGAAFATIGGERLPVDFALPGEQVEVRIPGGSAPVAQVARVLRASEHRVGPRCPYFGACGGCMWQHVAYDEQLRLKAAILRSLLTSSLGASAPTVNATIRGTADPWAFRNKVHFVFDGGGPSGPLRVGHYRRHSMDVVAVTECPVHDAAGNRVAFGLRDALGRSGLAASSSARGDRALLRHVVVRATVSPAETLATLVVVRNDKSLRPAVRAVIDGPSAPDGLHLNVHDRPGPYLFGRETRRLHGRERGRETIAGQSFLVSPTAFFQTNVRAAAAMVDYVLDHVPAVGVALDLYAGAGLFALPLARRGTRVTAVEENAQAVDDGEASRAFNRIGEGQCRFVRARTEAIVGSEGRRGIPSAVDLVVLDPPRAGCPRVVLDWICHTLRPSQLVYISCNPEALAADLRVPLGAGYRARAIQPIDMFPHTPHIETVALLEAPRSRR